MTARDRTVIIVVLALAAIAAGWLLRGLAQAQPGFEPELARSRASSPSSPASRARWPRGGSARTAFAGQYAQLAKLGEAVPPDDDIPSLIYQVQSAAQAAHVSFRGLQLSPPGSSSSSSSSSSELQQLELHRQLTTAAASTPLPPGAGVGAAGLPTEQFTFTLDGNFFNLSPTSSTGSRASWSAADNHLLISGRLMTINAISLAPGSNRLPADHRDRLGDDLHRPADTGPVRTAPRRPARRTTSPQPQTSTSGSSTSHSGRGHHPGAPMSFLPNMLKELRDRKLWPIALGADRRARRGAGAAGQEGADRPGHAAADRPAALLVRHHAARDLGADHCRRTRSWRATVATRSRPQRRRDDDATATTPTTTASTTPGTGTAASTSPAAGGSSRRWLQHRRRPPATQLVRRPHRRPPSRRRPSPRPPG